MGISWLKKLVVERVHGVLALAEVLTVAVIELAWSCKIKADEFHYCCGGR